MPEAQIDAAALARLARLSRLEVPASQIPTLADQLQRVLGHMARIEAMDLHGVPPTDHASASQTPWREDRVRPSLPLEAALRNAPERLGDGFGVPAILASSKAADA